MPDSPRKTRPLAWLLLFLFLAAVALTAATLLGRVPGLSAAAGTARPTDLGVRYDDDDLTAALRKLERGSLGGEAVLSQEEISAYLAHALVRSQTPVDDLQVRLHPGNLFEAAGTVVYRGREYPLYLRGRAHMLDDGLASTVEKARLAGVPVPSGGRERIERVIEKELQRRLAGEAGRSIVDMQTGDGTVAIVLNDG